MISLNYNGNNNPIKDSGMVFVPPDNNTTLPKVQGCNCKEGYTGELTQMNSGVMAYPQGTYFNNSCACTPNSYFSGLNNIANTIKNIQVHYINSSSSNSGGNNMNSQAVINKRVGWITQNQSSTASSSVSASSTSPVQPIQSLMNNWFSWGEQPNNTAGVEPINTQAALNPMTNQWQFFPSQASANANNVSASSANQATSATPTSSAQTALSNATSTASANASPQAQNGLSQATNEFQTIISDIFGSISDFFKKL